MVVNKAYKFRMYPTKEHEILINKTFGCAKLIYNNMLYNLKKDKYLSKFDMIKLIPSLYSEYEFLSEVDSCALRCAVFDLVNGLDKFKKGKGGYPNFKKKDSKKSYRTNNIRNEYKGKIYESIKVDLNKRIVTLPKLKEVSIRGYRNLSNIDGRIINATISREANKYYVSIIVEENIILPKKREITAVGIDLGVKSLVTTSDGEVIDNPKYLSKYERRIRRGQKSLSRKVVGSNNYKKQKIKIEEIYRKLRNARKKLAEEVVSKVIKYNDIIVSEKLKVSSMLESNKNNKSLRKQICNATFSEIIRKLEYKCRWLNKIYIQVDAYYPSSQICSVCGHIEKEMKDINKREYKCKCCGNKIERDINASINILTEGLFKYIKSKIITV